ncbi:hypothetical protein RHSIM_Rhsim06G0100900 [Rhododendron simsii]|uniref:SWIM-type domain-containing protein n=1 Tax=Rhododendron simsii TaxID=118357 RepID=A0A834GYP2_RHOSS|nr:hypothetical protein RHSIM_Rhsim06G0100900 [Rhododendron simsii]
MGTVVHDLVVHHNGQQSHIKNIDPGRYGHMELVADSCEVALTNVSARTDLALECYCFLSGSSVRMDIQNDKDLMAVFELYGGSRQIHLYFDVEQLPIPLNQYLLMSMLVMTLLTFDDVDWSEVGDYQFNDEGDELFDYSDSEDLDWDVNGGGKSDGGHSSTDSGDGSDIDGGHQTEDSEGGISNYESDDEGGQRSNDENDIQAFNADRIMGLIEASRMQIYRGKRKALEAFGGNHAMAYSKLRQYAVEVIKTNPGSLVKLETEKIPSNVNFPTFKRLALDGNNGLYPVAFGLVERECNESCAFFLYYLHPILGDCLQQRPWTIMSDGQKLHYSKLCQRQHIEGVADACLQTLKVNSLDLRRSFWAAARAYTVRDLNYAMAVIKDTSTEAHDWLMGLPVQMWAMHAFESLTFLVTPIKKRLDEVVDHSRACKITFAGGEEYQVVEGVVSHVVNLKARTCCCKVWEISGLPCKHAASCISHKRMDVEEFCHTYYHGDT